jgi:hypothetical protein
MLLAEYERVSAEASLPGSVPFETGALDRMADPRYSMQPEILRALDAEAALRLDVWLKFKRELIRGPALIERVGLAAAMGWGAGGDR